MAHEPAASVQRRDRTFARDAAFFVALLATAIAFGAALAHALELPAKMALSREEYFVAQQLYQGWDRLALVLLVELAAMISVAVLYRSERRVLMPGIAAIVFLAAAQAVFWIFTFPANQATENWTAMPPEWERLRTSWEYSHLAGAGFQFLALVSLLIAVLRR